jgi:hypothetical protein
LQIDIEALEPIPKRRHRSDIGSGTKPLQIIMIHHHREIEQPVVTGEDKRFPCRALLPFTV